MKNPYPNFKSAALITLTLTAFSAAANAQAYEDFQQSDYGTSNVIVPGLNGGSGWAGAWVGNGNVRFEPVVNLDYTAATGYGNAVTTSGSIQTSVAGGPFYVNRDFSSTSITSGDIWVSWIGNRLSNNFVDDRLGFSLTDGSTTRWVGNRQDDFGIGSGNGFTNLVEDTGSFTTATNHLVVVHFDLDAGSISAWLNPSDVTSVGNLGTATVTTASGLTSSNGNILFQFQEDGANRVSMDALRIGSTLDSVSVIPEPSALALLAGSLAIGVVMLKRRR